MENHDGRILAVLCMWLDNYSRWILASRLTKLVEKTKSQRVRAFWSAFAVWKKSDPRFIKLSKIYQGQRIYAYGKRMKETTEFLIQRHGGEDERFRNGPMIAARTTIRQRDSDAINPSQIVKRHKSLRYRIMMGPTYRADLWAELERQPDLSVAELARKTYASYKTAREVKNDRLILYNDSRKKKQEVNSSVFIG
jgi:hypothetical protein